FRKIDRRILSWLAVLIFQFLLFAILSLLRDEALMKRLRDLMIVPVFVALGLSSARIGFTKILLCITPVIGACALWEAFDATRFLSIFSCREFYLTKGSFDPTIPVMLHTFISGVRPDRRFLIDIPDLHRI